MGSQFSTYSTPKLPIINVKLQMEYILTNWYRSVSKSDIASPPLPVDIMDLIVDTYLFQPIFDTLHQSKLYTKQKQTASQVSDQNKKVSSKIKRAYDHLFRFRVVGDSRVGKSCLILRYCDDSFVNSHITRIGVDFRLKGINIDDKNFKLMLWDTYLGDRYRFSEYWYRKMHAIIIVYDITDRESFENIKKWNKEILARANDDVLRVLIGTKSDLKHDRKVSCEEANEMAKELGIEYCAEVSAKTGQNVNNVINLLALRVYNIPFIKEKRKIMPFFG